MVANDSHANNYVIVKTLYEIVCQIAGCENQ